VDRFIGWFLESAARGSSATVLHDVLAGHKVSQAMNRQYAAIPATLLCKPGGRSHFGERSAEFVVKRVTWLSAC